jgi:hypothetical protein
LHLTGQAARGIPEITFYYFWIVPIYPRLQGGSFSAPAGKARINSLIHGDGTTYFLIL